jgi:hypothetical protein
VALTSLGMTGKRLVQDKYSVWVAVNCLKLNEDKTDALLVSSKDNVAKKRIASIPFVVGDASIIPSPVVRNLGTLT